MHKIDIHNYEAYLLDFSEGNLTDECQMELELFLIQHPELNVDLSELSLVALENEAINFSDKNNLKKSETDLVSETQFISYIENQLSTEERLLIEKSCATNPFLSKELSLYNSTIISDDKSVVYLNKNELKRKPKVIWFNFSARQFSAAASVLFLIGLFIFWPKTAIRNDQLADKLIKGESITKKSGTNNVIIPLKNAVNITTSIKENNVTMPYNTVITELHQHLAKNTTTPPNESTTPTFKDSLRNLVINISPPEGAKNETFIAQNAPTLLKENKQTIVEVITENDEETITVNTDKKKTGIWATVSRTLKNLNHVGVKSVNGDEENNKENTSYALTLGGISITHKSGL